MTKDILLAACPEDQTHLLQTPSSAPPLQGLSGEKVSMADAPCICSVGIAGESIIALAAMCLGSEDVGLQAEAARLCASVAAMPHK